ncbi:hypothetical protein MMYC01_208654 [Madurella mycetomatis]|uniref:Heterokaryon incompatibility domain-containing protein n=1 Tax=Madurella mycetomatis TaxID=100816 RepID=A0A175VU85_9PEZI|nr:hypothetical protein MMYC01_208654 [Madurella mycetomatis]
MVLRAALSNYRDSRGIRRGKGYWRAVEPIGVPGEDGVQTFMCIKHMGSSAPVKETRYNTPIRDHLLPSGPMSMTLIRDTVSALSPKAALIAPTGKVDADLDHIEDGDVVGIEASDGTTPPRLRLFGSMGTDSALFSYIPGRVRELDSSSDTAFRRLQCWIQQCTSTHEKCATPALNPPLPTRVIDVDSLGGSVAVFESNGLMGRYTALSHSWGTSPRLMATKATLEDLKEGITLSSLPKTFQDAIEITRRLGIKYL